MDAVTAASGGRVPRYAMIVAKYAKEIMRRSGADQVNLETRDWRGTVRVDITDYPEFDPPPVNAATNWSLYD